MAFSTVAQTARLLARSPDAKWLVVGNARVKVPQDHDAQLAPDDSGQMVKYTHRALLVATGSIVLARETTGTYDGEDIVVREVLPIENGDLQRVHIVAADA